MLWSIWRALFHPITLPSEIDNLENETDVDSRGGNLFSLEEMSVKTHELAGVAVFMHREFCDSVHLNPLRLNDSLLASL